MPRLFVRVALNDVAQVEIDPAQANYLGNVMRLSVGDAVLLFDGSNGEWLARITGASKRHMTLAVEQRLREQEAVPDLVLAFAPVKRAQTDWLVEKATELGVSRLIPVITARTIVERVKRERLETIAIEASEQCHRTTVPQIAEPIALAKLLNRLDRPLYFADEQGGEPAAGAFRAGRALILTGPEGGFTDEERRAIRGTTGAIAIGLGPRILRAETAALAAIALFMAAAGDWSSTPGS